MSAPIIPESAKKTSGAPLQADRDAILQFLRDVVVDAIQLTAIQPDGPIETHWFGTDHEAAADWAVEWNGEGRGIYWTVNRSKPIHKKPKKVEMKCSRGIHGDYDPPKDGSPWDKRAVLRKLLDAPLPPTVVIDSGGGLNTVRWLKEDTTEFDAVEGINHTVANGIDGGDFCHNHDRILRVPGTVNWPNKKKRKAGRVPVLAKLVHHDPQAVYALADMAQAYPPTEVPEKAKGNGSAKAQFAPDCRLLTADDLTGPDGCVLSKLSGLRELIENPRGDDRSADTFALACHMLKAGYTTDEVAGILLNPANAVSAYCLKHSTRAEQERAAQRTIEAALRDPQVRAGRNNVMGEGIFPSKDRLPTTKIYTPEEMLAQLVFIKEGSRVADRRFPRSRLSLSDFKNSTLASVVTVQGNNGKPRTIPCADVWLKDEARLDVDTITFKAGAGELVRSPDEGKPALNLWKPQERGPCPEEWEKIAQFFVDHVCWLWGNEADAFLDWLAHAEQNPGELPHSGWLHVSEIHGKGRNWIAGVLARVWSGNVATSVDLGVLTEKSFNGCLSCKVLAIVDEVREGGQDMWRQAQNIRTTLSEERRRINPKYGAQHHEWNACRWLLFSNHTNALPLDEKDRRFRVAEHKGPVKPPRYYQRLYWLLEQPDFIRSVAEFLNRRDISSFNPGKLPPMNAAKQALVNANKSDEEKLFEDIAQRWPVDVITGVEITELTGSQPTSNRARGYALDRAGIKSVRKIKVGRGLNPFAQAYALRNHDKWGRASPAVLRQEVDRATRDDKLDALSGEDSPNNP